MLIQQLALGKNFPLKDIINGAVEVKTEPVLATGKIATIQTTLNTKYKLNIKVDNIYGNETKKALIKALQTELKGLTVDGIFGVKTKAKVVNVKEGDKGNLVWIVQAFLICKGYELTLDGIFGADTKKKVKAYQLNNNLTADGIVGKNTFTKMFN